MASGLYLYSVGRQSMLQTKIFKQYNIYNGYMRHMARSELDICVLGPSSWYRADGNIFNKILPNLNPFYFNNPKKIKWLLTFLFLVLSWILFRSPNIETATIILTGAFTANFVDMEHFFTTNLFFLILLAVFALSHRYDSLVNVRLLYRRSKKVVLATIILMNWIIILGLSTPRSNSFIYIDF